MSYVRRFLLCLCTGALVGSVAPAAADASGGVALFDRTAVAGTGADFSSQTVATDAPRRSILIAQGSYDSGHCPYQATNPGVLCLLYKNGTFSSSSSSAAASTPGYVGGVSYAYANANDPQWFLLSSSGARLSNPEYPALWAMDVGNASYQNMWASNAIAAAKQYGWGGVFADDLPCWPYNLTGTPAKYPTQAAWQGAVQSFLNNVGAQLHAAGLKLISNSAACGPYGTTLHNYAAAEDGVMEEGWMRNTTSPTQALATASNGVWGEELRELTDAENNGKYYLAELPSYASDTQAIRYGLATQLLGAAGHSMFDISGAPSNYSQASWFPDYDTAVKLGAPSGAYSELSDGAYRRNFANGTVLVNPTGSTLPIALGATYSGSGLTNVSSVTMAPETGLILTGSGSGSGGSGSGGSVLQNGSFDSGGLSPWSMVLQGSASATDSQDCTTADGGSCSAKVAVSASVSGYPWYVSFQQANLSLTANESYTLAFYAKASASRSIEVTLQQQGTGTMYEDKLASLTTGWQKFTFSVPAQAFSGSTALRFFVGQATGTVWLDGVTLTSP